ncbi:MAG TPA: DNA repair protein RecN [Gemmatimonadota bacterium]
MLASLRIENLALVESLELDLAPGLNVLSGETGAGKSVLVEALSLLVGERADPDMVRAGASSAVVEGVFRLEAPATRRAVARALGEDAEEVALRRELFRDQRNRCFVAGRLATAGLLRELGERLVELHGQHEHQLLLRRTVQRELLDAFGGLEPQRLALERGVEDWRTRTRRLEAIRQDERTRAERIRALADEVAEISAAGVDLEREPELRAEAERLRHVEDRLALAAGIAHALAGAEPGALDLLRTARGELQALARDEPRFATAAGRLAASVEELADLERELQRYLEALTRDPARLAELDAREALLLRLTRRHGLDLAGLVEREAASRAALAALEGEAVEARDLEREVTAAGGALLEAARALSRSRARAAGALAREVMLNLRDLDMGRGDFDVALEPLADLEPAGLERVEFRIAPNAGEPAAALSSIASGGELSRVTLALKAALARVDRVPTLVFDEIDVGIGGRVARRVAEKLAGIAATRQVIAVTHLAQIAAHADLHLRVEKVVRGGRTLTTAAPLSGEERVEEVSRMLGAEPGSDTSRRYAEELLLAAAREGSLLSLSGARGTAPAGRGAAARSGRGARPRGKGAT